MFANGSTATDLACDTVAFGMDSVFVGVVSCPETSACANIAEVAKRLIQGDPLSAQEEARLLASGWRVSQSP